MAGGRERSELCERIRLGARGVRVWTRGCLAGLVACACATSSSVSPRSLDRPDARAEPATSLPASVSSAHGDAEGAEPSQTPGLTPLTPQPEVERVLEVQPVEPIRHGFHAPLPGPEAFARAPARRYANLSAGQCRAELAKLKLATRPAAGPARGVATPVTISGPLAGVRFVTPGRRSVYGTLDCRLVLALHEFAKLLAEHRVTTVHVDNLYRPKARLPGRRHKRSQHAYGLALDIMAVTLADGRTLSVERDWQGALAAPPCGPESEVAAFTDEAVALRNIVCAAVRTGLFHHVLTPNYDAAHRDHLHLDIKRDARAIVVR